MLIGQILNSDAELNTFDILGTLDVIPGSEIELVVRLLQHQRKDKLRYVPTGIGTTTLTLQIPTSSGTPIDLEMEAMEGDASIWTGEIDAEDSEDIIGGNVTFTLVEDLGEGVTKTHLGWIQNAIAIIQTGQC